MERDLPGPADRLESLDHFTNICPAEFEDNFQCCSSSVTRLFTQPGEGQVGVADVSPL